MLFILSWSEYPDGLKDKVWLWGSVTIGLLFVEGSSYVFYYLLPLSFDIGFVLIAIFLVLVFGAGLKILWSSLPVLHSLPGTLLKIVTTAPDQNKVLELLNQHQNLVSYKDIKAFEKAFEDLDLKKLNTDNLTKYSYLYGLCAFQYKDHELAKERFETALQDCPDNIQIMFSLAQECIFLDQPDKAFALFDRLVFPDISGRYILAMSRYAYLYGEHDRGIQYLMPLIHLYNELKILDGTFLKIRGLPFFDQTWSYFAAHCVLSKGVFDIELLSDMTMETMSICQDYDFDFLYMEMLAVIEKRYVELIKPLKKIRDKRKDKGLFTGYEDLRIAVFESFKQDSFDGACKCIDSVTLTDDDFPWLKDVCTLALAQAADRFDEEASWIRLMKAFFVQQPMMFEPDIALTFGLLEYQESIKHLVEKPFRPGL